MESLPKTVLKRTLRLAAYVIGVSTILGGAFSSGLLSARAFEIAFLAFGATIVFFAVHIMRTSKERESPPLNAERRKRLFGVRLGKVAIMVLVLLLANGLFQDGPAIPKLVGATTNVCMIIVIASAIRRLEKKLH